MKILSNPKVIYAFSLIVFALARSLSSEVFFEIYKSHQPNFLDLNPNQIDVINRFSIILLVSMIHYMYSMYCGIILILKNDYQIKDYQTLLMILNSFILLVGAEWFKSFF